MQLGTVSLDDSDDDEIKVSGKAVQLVKDIQVRVLAEVAKHLRVSDARRVEIENVAQVATEEAVAAVRKICSRIEKRNERQEVQQDVQFQEMLRQRKKEQDELIQLKQLLALRDQELSVLRQAQEAKSGPAQPMEVDETSKPGWWEKACGLEGASCDAFPLIAVQSKSEAKRSEKKFDVTDAMHSLHAQFRCQRQPFPIMPGHPGIPADATSRCQCGLTLTVSDLISNVPQPVNDHRVETVLEAARVLAIWNGVRTLTDKVKWICDPFHRRIFEIGWKIAKTTDWNLVLTEIGKKHHKALVVVPETLKRLKHLQKTIKNVDVFYYRKFSEVHLRKNELFRNELGHVVFVMPSLEPKQTGCWLPFVAAMDMWLGIGCRLYLVAGPVGREQSSWFRVAERARSHVHRDLEYRPEKAEQIVDKLPVSAGVIPADSPCLEVGMIDDDKAWIPEAGVQKFYSKMADVLSS
ncbi:unnamed protein product [Heligmosomoides polygyrus]|uniref:ULP_PROTEASE domain-containing protein n=1 Tax=Heligmosomoides polygyrus TaxID=6339 RepID=A0A3P8AU82_HELPZ|nr:unnamed protein product [Heligmosomoides polygyrus]